MDTKTAPVTPLLQFTSYNLIIPIDLERKIRTICKTIWNKEWSGILFYDYTGSIEEDNLILKCVDIVVLDVGTSTTTEFKMSPEVVDYIAEHPELADSQTGLIHSHNNMATFFSGTDLQTLYIEGKERNHFLSLIVNNNGNYTAAITRCVKHTITKHDCIVYKTFNDKEVVDYEDSIEEIPHVVEYFNLNITIEGEDKDLISKLNSLEIGKSKEFSTKEPMVHDIPFVSTNRDYYFPNNIDNNRNSREDKKLKELTLFDDYLDYKTPSTPSTPITPTLINAAICQLLTGCIVADSSKIDTKAWVNKMERVFDNRFKNIKDFELFADPFVENIIYNGEELATYDDDSIQQFAKAIIIELQKFPQNKYIKVYIKLIKNWLV